MTFRACCTDCGPGLTGSSAFGNLPNTARSIDCLYCWFSGLLIIKETSDGLLLKHQ